MATVDDAWGLPVTSSSAPAVERWNDTITAFLAMRIDIGDLLKAALDADPEMPLGHVTRGVFLRMFNTAKMDAAALASHDKAAALMEGGGATARERAHLTGLKAWLDGEMEQACQIWEAILIQHPRDVLAIKLAQLNRFYLGDAAGMRDGLARCLYAWDDGVRGHSYILGSYAFALEECGVYARAEAMGRAAVDAAPADIWAAHAVAHVMEMQNRADEGLAWLDDCRAHWHECHNFRHHAHWHRALFALELGRFETALEIYDADVWTDKVADYLDFSNGAALLWRLQDLGVDVGDRWASVADMSAAMLEHHALAFIDCHHAVALAGAGRTDDLTAYIGTVGRFADARGGTQERLAGRVTLPICRAIEAIAAGKADTAVDLLYDVRTDVRLIGGSHAQRDLFDRMLVSAALAAGRNRLARALLSERIEARPNDAWSAARRDSLQGP